MSVIKLVVLICWLQGISVGGAFLCVLLYLLNSTRVFETRLRKALIMLEKTSIDFALKLNISSKVERYNVLNKLAEVSLRWSCGMHAGLSLQRSRVRIRLAALHFAGPIRIYSSGKHARRQYKLFEEF